MTIFAVTADAVYSDKVRYNNSITTPKAVTKQVEYDWHGTFVVFVGAGYCVELARAYDIIKDLMARTLPPPDIHTFTLEAVYKELENLRLERGANDICVVLARDGDTAVYYVGENGYALPMDLPYVGGHTDAVKVATGALDAGASPDLALKIAMARTGIASNNLNLDVTELHRR